jgi:hypothetical protein
MLGVEAQIVVVKNLNKSKLNSAEMYNYTKDANAYFAMHKKENKKEK